MCTEHEKKIRLLEETNQSLSAKVETFVSQYNANTESQAAEHKKILEQLAVVQHQFLKMKLSFDLELFIKNGESLIQDYDKEKDGLGVMAQKTMKEEAQQQQDLYYKEEIAPKMYL